ncbi:hypothetical protein [Janthinobacterium sp. MDT1-19]|uniref:hypothetical protein n=1 Tax=Janthinobacterium sp. MDT1-19 TaxID=1259339 RepID=UPI003F2635F6
MLILVLIAQYCLKSKVLCGSSQCSKSPPKSGICALNGGGKYLPVGRQRKKSRFFKIFSNRPKVLPGAAVNNHMNGAKPLKKNAGLLNIFRKSPKVPAKAAVI